VINASSAGGFVAQLAAALYAGTKFAVCAICVYQGVTNTEIAGTISDETTRKSMGTYRKLGIEQPDDVDVNKIVVRPPVTQV